MTRFVRILIDIVGNRVRICNFENCDLTRKKFQLRIKPINESLHGPGRPVELDEPLALLIFV